MPELPEVETVMRGLARAMVGRSFAEVRVRRPDLRFPLPPDMACRLRGCSVTALTRRAKYILAHLDSGDVLLMHLGMSGRFTVRPPHGALRELGEFYFQTRGGDEPLGVHDHVVFTLSDGTCVIYTDPRRFGIMDLFGAHEEKTHWLLSGIGVEPLGNALNAPFLQVAFAKRRVPLKAALLDQKLIAGLGNIYACEALHRARLSPFRLAESLARTRRPDRRLEALAAAIRQVLIEAIEAGGSTLRDYAAADGTAGFFQQRFAVYGREGKACPRTGCRGTVRRRVQSARSTFYCAMCQR